MDLIRRIFVDHIAMKIGLKRMHKFKYIIDCKSFTPMTAAACCEVIRKETRMSLLVLLSTPTPSLPCQADLERARNQLRIAQDAKPTGNDKHPFSHVPSCATAAIG